MSNNRGEPAEQLTAGNKTVTLRSGERQQGVGRGRGFRGVGGTDYRPPGVASREPSATTRRIQSNTNSALGGVLTENHGG